MGHFSLVQFSKYLLLFTKYFLENYKDSPRAHAHTCMHANTHTHIYTHIYAHTGTHSHICANTCTHTEACIHIFIHTYVHMHTHVCTWTCTDSYMHTYTQKLLSFLCCFSVRSAILLVNSPTTSPAQTRLALPKSAAL